MGLSQAQLTGSVNPVLTEHAQRLRPVGFIADEVFPKLNKLGIEKGQIQVWDETNLEVPDDTQRAIGGEASTAKDPEPTYKSYTTARHSRKILLTQRELDIYEKSGQDPEMLKMAKTGKLVDQLNLIREKNLADKLNTSANYETGYSTTLTNTWATDAGDPLNDIHTGIKKLEDGGIFPTHIIQDISVWRYLERHSALLEFMKYTKGGKITKEDFQSIFGLIPVIGKARYKSGSTKAAVWQDSSIICYIDTELGDNSPESDVTFGRTIMEMDFSIVEYDAPEKDHKGAMWIEAEQGYAHEFIAVDNVTDGDSIAGYLIDNAI